MPFKYYLDKEELENVKILDTLDLLPYISETDTLYNVIDKIEDAAPILLDNDTLYGDILQGYIFNQLDYYAIMEYLGQRYGTRFEERIEHWVSYKGKNNDINE